MTIKQWYKTLLDDQILMNVEDDSLPQLIACRVELLNPSCNWKAIWSNVRMKGLTSELMSFLFKLVHQLLPSRNRIARMSVGGTSDNRCLLCNTNSEENLIHAFFMCPNNHIAGLALLGFVQKVEPNLSEEDAVTLNFSDQINDTEKLAVLYLLGTGLKFIWECRIEKKTIQLYVIRAKLEAKIELLRKTRYVNIATLMSNMIM